MFPSWFPSRWRLSPLFYEGAQILFFPAPISYLGERYLPAAGEFRPIQNTPGAEALSSLVNGPAKAVPRYKARCAAAHSMSRIIGLLVGRYYARVSRLVLGKNVMLHSLAKLATVLGHKFRRSDYSRRSVTPASLRNSYCTNLRRQNLLGQRFRGPAEPLQQWPAGCTGIDMEINGNETTAHGKQPGALENYDLIILGGGTGSTVAAWTLAAQGQRVAVIERKYIGGSCPNIACLPSKNILHSARVASYFRRGEEFGMFADNFHVDMAAVLGRKRAMVSALNNLYLDNYKQTGAEFILGSGRFVGPKTLEVALPGGVISPPPRSQCNCQHWYAGCIGTNSWPGRCPATHPHRGTRIGSAFRPN